MSCVQGEISVIRGGTGDPGLRHVPARLPGSGPDISVLAAASLAGIPASQGRAVLTELTRTSLAAEHRPGRCVLHDLLGAYAAGHAAWACSEAEIHAAVGRSLDHYLHTMASLPSFWDSHSR
jgi:hypothetical protein